MLSSNRFIFNLNQRLQHYPVSKRLTIVQKIVDDLEPTGILKPLDFEYDEDSEPNTIAFGNAMRREDRIIVLQKLHGTFSEADEKAIKLKQISSSRCGRSDLHDAVKMGDVNLIKRIYKSDSDSVKRKNNNGYDPIAVAFLEENQEAINAFCDLGLVAAEFKQITQISYDEYGNNDMHNAVKIGSVSLIKKIYYFDSSSVNHQNNNGYNPICIAFMEENQEIINLFDEMGLIPSC